MTLDYFFSSTTQDRSTVRPKCDPNGIRTHDLQLGFRLMTSRPGPQDYDSTFHVTEMPTLTTRP